MDSSLYERLRAYKEVLTHYNVNRIFAGGDLGDLESISIALGYAPTNFGCSVCKGELLDRMFHALNRHEKETQKNT